MKFLQLLADFYRSDRYNRYNLASVYEPNREKRLVDFLAAELKIEIKNEFPFVTENDNKIRRFIGRLVEKIALQLYQVIRDEAQRLRIYVDEVRSESKAYKLFVAKQFNFEPERYLQRELLIHLLRSEPSRGFREFMDSLEPLPFDPGLNNLYIKFLMDFHHHVKLQGELDAITEDTPLKKTRIEQVDLIGTDFDFETGYEDEDWDDL